MIFLVLIISFNLLSTGNLQELNDADGLKLTESWPVQSIQTVQGNFFGQAFRNINPKPCSGRRNIQNLDEQWIPTFSSKFITPTGNLDNANLKPQAIKEENYAPDETLVVEENDPIVVSNDDQNNLLKAEDAIEVQDEIASKDRSEVQPTASIEDTLSLVNDDNDGVAKYNEDDKFSEDLGMVELDSRLAENEPESWSKLESVKLTEGCLNKNNKIREENVIGQSRRSMSELGKETDVDHLHEIAEADLLNENISNNINNLKKQLNDDNKNRRTAKDGDTNKNVIMRKGTPTKVLTNGKGLENRNELEPTKGSGVSELSESRVMLMDYSRLCYACSTANNPRCWAPDRHTTVKYCRKGHEDCVTKTFQLGNTLTLVRDCGNSCEDVDIPGLIPKYKSCSICHSDLCNSAYTINNQNVIFAFLLITVIKYMY